MTSADMQITPPQASRFESDEVFRPPEATTRMRMKMISLARWLSAFALFIALAHAHDVRAEAEPMDVKDISLSLFQVIDPFNRFWYFYPECESGDRQVIPCGRFNLNAYEAIPNLPDEGPIGTTVVSTTGIRAEYGLMKNLTLTGETRLVYSTRNSPRLALGDSRLGARWNLVREPLFVSVASIAKIPGVYDPRAIGAPGAAQPDLEFKTLFGGFAFRRRLFYDIGFGYRIRFPYPVAEVVFTPMEYRSEDDMTGTPAETPAARYAIRGPADEVFFDLTAGLFFSRMYFPFLHINAVNSTKGESIDVYFSSNDVDEEGRPLWDFSEGVDPSNLLTILEEDYLRMGVGLLVRAFPRGTIYFDYSYVVLGRNTTAYYVLPDIGIPIGTFALGIEYTFGPSGEDSSRSSTKETRRMSRFDRTPRLASPSSLAFFR